MTSCTECELPKQMCLCKADFLSEDAYGDYLEDLDELRAMKAPGATRCLACYFFNCRCKKGLKSK